MNIYLVLYWNHNYKGICHIKPYILILNMLTRILITNFNKILNINIFLIIPMIYRYHECRYTIFIFPVCRYHQITNVLFADTNFLPISCLPKPIIYQYHVCIYQQEREREEEFGSVRKIEDKRRKVMNRK